MKQKLILIIAAILIFNPSFGQLKNGHFIMGFQPNSELVFNLDQNKFTKVSEFTSKSNSSDFTVSGYYLASKKYSDILVKAKGQLTKTFQCSEENLFVEKIAKPFYEGEIIFGTNGTETSCIYIFEFGSGVYWVTMTFPHNSEETDKVDEIIGSITDKP